MNDDACDGPELYEDDLENFERNQLAADHARDSAEDADLGLDEDGLPDEELLAEALVSEFALLGYRTPGRAALERMAVLLARQQVDFGEVGITAAALGWIAHAEAVREL
jgi:hypothetical protein